VIELNVITLLNFRTQILTLFAKALIIINPKLVESIFRFLNNMTISSNNKIMNQRKIDGFCIYTNTEQSKDNKKYS
jgi:hypothetical protein